VDEFDGGVALWQFFSLIYFGVILLSFTEYQAVWSLDAQRVQYSPAVVCSFSYWLAIGLAKAKMDDG